MATRKSVLKDVKFWIAILAVVVLAIMIVPNPFIAKWQLGQLRNNSDKNDTSITDNGVYIPDTVRVKFDSLITAKNITYTIHEEMPISLNESEFRRGSGISSKVIVSEKISSEQACALAHYLRDYQTKKSRTLKNRKVLDYSEYCFYFIIPGDIRNNPDYQVEVHNNHAYTINLDYHPSDVDRNNR